MNSAQTADTIAAPLGTVGMMYYFDKGTVAKGKEINLDVVSFYALGRGGVLNDVPAEQVDEVFFFFKPGAITAMYSGGRAVQPADVGARAHLEAADDFARRTFGGVSNELLAGFNASAATLIASLPTGRWPLVDGYRQFDLPSDDAALAMRYAILLRELRGGVHTDAIKAAGLSSAEACYLDHDGAYFALHGFQDADIPEVTDELRQRRQSAEADTSVRMSALLDVLSDDQRAALVDGAAALHAALADPQPVS